MASVQPKSPGRVHVICPQCKRRLSTPATHIGKRGRCPHCSHTFVIEPAKEPDKPISQFSRFRSKIRPVLKQSLTYIESAIAWLVLAALQHPIRAALLSFITLILLVDVRYFFIFLPFISVYASYATATHKVRRLRQLVFYIIWLGLPGYFAYGILMMSLVTNYEGAFACLLMTLLVGVPSLAIGPWVSRFLTPYILAICFVRRLTCPGCHEAYPLVDRWACNCGYTDHRSRNIILFKCPKCSEHLGQLDCLSCGATILF